MNLKLFCPIQEKNSGSHLNQSSAVKISLKLGAYPHSRKQALG